MLEPITNPLNYPVQIRVILHLPQIHLELENCASLSEFPGESQIVPIHSGRDGLVLMYADRSILKVCYVKIRKF